MGWPAHLVYARVSETPQNGYDKLLQDEALIEMVRGIKAFKHVYKFCLQMFCIE